MKIKIETESDREKGEIIQTVWNNDEIVEKWVFDTRRQHVAEILASWGWIPPNTEKAQT